MVGGDRGLELALLTTQRTTPRERASRERQPRRAALCARVRLGVNASLRRQPEASELCERSRDDLRSAARGDRMIDCADASRKRPPGAQRRRHAHALD